MPLRRLDPVWFRLLTREPFEPVVFPSATYTLEIAETIGGAYDWHFRACEIGAAACIDISESYRRRDWLEAALYVEGFATRHATIGETIMLRLVQLGRAERLDAPLIAPEHGRGWPWMWP